MTRVAPPWHKAAMSWDVDLVRLGESASRIPHHFDARVVGEFGAIKAQLSQLIEPLTWVDGTGRWEEGSCLFACSLWRGRTMSTHGDVDAISLWIRGHGEPMPCIARICRALDVVACDVGQMTLLDLEDPAPIGWTRFRNGNRPGLRAIRGGRSERSLKA